MKPEADSVELCSLLSSIVRAIVSDPDAVRVSSSPSPSGSTIIQIKVSPGRDVAKLIGRQGRTARSLRIIVQVIGKERGRDYHLDIDETNIDSTLGAAGRVALT
jgi:predicted RNA-binding protein YlqC (UPF0109 family)